MKLSRQLSTARASLQATHEEAELSPKSSKRASHAHCPEPYASARVELFTPVEPPTILCVGFLQLRANLLQPRPQDCVARRDCQSDIDIDMIRVIQWVRSQPDYLSVSSGYTIDQFVRGVPLGSPKTSYVPLGSHVARVRERASRGRGKSKSKLARDQK
ncbi:hypothetical protein E5676_scaffold214G00270 [Cucumis melo var. makuwa]|uniref:Uncharacterized protein n=1 Tax=Cucumis melo var. makuwa TaxID=1194695 RepID=A0A5D3D848_CUCMM|nr:hypothetical protein E6C27_scaffold69G00460 [Cucumis melo var. makuwa]TYK19724.1 hypothetical protein E5676_scaffold214G00270 [Cucumis melo var. makuwa]